MGWEYLRDTTRTARKRHQCFLCCRPICVGETYIERAGASDGDILTMRMHVPCEKETQEWRFGDWEGFSAGDLLEHMERIEAAAERERNA